MTAEPEPRLCEWDYGPEEGRTTAQARQTRPDWSVWADSGLGETLEQLADRQRAVLSRVQPIIDDGHDACLVGHGHALRVLAACYLGLAAGTAQQLVLGAGSISVLGSEHGSPALLSWNT